VAVGSRSMVVAYSDGGGVEVDSGSAIMTKSLRKRMVVARPEAGVEAAACSGTGVEDGRWRRRHSGFSGDSRARESARLKIC
jgi:hypothetical protein